MDAHLRKYSNYSAFIRFIQECIYDDYHEGVNMEAQSNRRSRILGEPGSLRKTYVASIGIGLAMLCWSALPALLDRGHVAEDVMHGSAIPSAFGTTAFLLVLGLGTRKIGLCKADGRSPWPYFWSMLGSLFFLGFLAILFFVERDYQLAADLRARGISIQARLVRQFAEGCGKHGCTTGLEYSFVPKGQIEVVRGFADEGDTSRHPNAEFNYAISTGTLPILYDPANPNRSLVNWDNRILRANPFHSSLKMIEIFTGLLAFAIALLGLLLSPIARAVSASEVEQP